MKRKIVVILVTLMFLCTLCMGTSSIALAQTVDEKTEVVFSTEDTGSVTESIPGTGNNVSNQLTTEELERVIAELIAKVNSLTGENAFFKNKILPFIVTGFLDLIVVGIILLVPYMKNKSRAKKLEGFAQALQGEKQNLTKLLSSTDAPAIQKALTETFGAYIDKMMVNFKKEFGLYMETFASIKTTVETEYAQIKNLIEAARQAWASKPEVVALLAESPDRSTLEQQIAENEKLKQYIRDIKGVEAEKIINNLGV